MTAITFDTLKFANRLKAAGVPSAQAEAEAIALSEAMTEAITASDLASKNDLRETETKVIQLMHEMELRITKWIIGLSLAQFALLIGVLLRLPH